MKKMKASTAKLLSMLPRTFEMHFDMVDGGVVGVDIRTPDGKPTGIDPEYPGFAQCLARLIEAGLVFGIAEKITGTKAKARAVQSYITCRPEVGPEHASKPNAAT